MAFGPSKAPHFHARVRAPFRDGLDHLGALQSPVTSLQEVKVLEEMLKGVVCILSLCGVFFPPP